ncbi:hypothetical protein [Cerasicoccus maritimus]|uniref:hypothetical protein n=1 Tax=Cerasicoccus maritimus TaxID=490089 RepID=UPI002852DAA7|nr:hypothetical protein [Cerasicoccus maritimus]
MSPRIVFTLAALLAPIVTHATKAIANWDVVPYQRVSEPFNAGVVAFHETGVDVHFRINGETAGVVKEPTLNARTKVWEYWITIDPAKYPDGPLKLEAVAVPEGEGNEKRMLDTMLYANSGKTLGSKEIVWMSPNGDDAADGSEGAPFATFKQAAEAAGDGGTIYLQKGDYKLLSFGKGDQDYWTTISAAPGLDRSDVTIQAYGKDNKVSHGRYGADKIRWHNVSLYCDRESKWGSVFYINKGQCVWFDDVEVYDKNGRFGDTQFINNQGGRIWLTDSVVRDIANVQINFQRNAYYHDILADIFRGSNNLTAINVNIVHMDKGDTAAHPDFIQFYNPKRDVENVILYNVSAYDMFAQGFFGGGRVQDVAFVNVLLEKDPPEASFLSQIGDMSHILIWNVTIVDQSFNFRGAETMDLVYVQNGAYTTLSSAKYDHPGFFVDHCHASKTVYNQPDLMGTNATTGDMVFVNYDADDYRQAPESPAYASGQLPPGVPADIDGVPYDPAAPNRGAFAKANPGGRRPSVPLD